MKRARAALATLGGATFALGVAILLAPGLADLVPVEAALAVFDNGYLLVAAFGVVALVVVVTVLLVRGVAGINQTSPPEPESAGSAPRPGEGFDDLISGIDLRSALFESRREQVRDRLHDAAVTAVMRETGDTRSEARERVERGTWTNDAEAAAFLAGERTPGASTRVAAVLRGETAFQRGARRSARAVARYDAGGRR